VIKLNRTEMNMIIMTTSIYSEGKADRCKAQRIVGIVKRDVGYTFEAIPRLFSFQQCVTVRTVFQHSDSTHACVRQLN